MLNTVRNNLSFNAQQLSQNTNATNSNLKFSSQPKCDSVSFGSKLKSGKNLFSLLAEKLGFQSSL